MKSVCILISTYNGERFLREQLDSLLAQQGVEVSILIRDDGSTDNTLSIIEQYIKKYSCVSLYDGENLGPAMSFLDLIAKSPDVDYYAFCDQDDIWDEDKLLCAVTMLEKEDYLVPNLYYSNLRIVDKDLKFCRNSHEKPFIHKSKYSALYETLTTGCTMVFNRPLRDLVAAHLPQKCIMHDVWVYVVCKFFGNTVYDFEPHISYRQHENNVIGTFTQKKNLRVYLKKFKRLFNRSFQPRYDNAKSFYNSFSKLLNGEELKEVEKLVFYKDSFKNWMELLFDGKIVAMNKERDFFNRLLILLRII